ncbi:MAG TPA: ABC transporter substrate-binding protein [Candidatus Eremiobacteraceae bacterium]
MVQQERLLFVAIAVFGIAAASIACTAPSPKPNAIVAIAADLPLAGRDGGDGIMALHAVAMAVADANRRSGQSLHFELEVRDTSRGGFQDPHTDEATDPIFDGAHGVEDVAAFAKDVKVLGVIGPYEDNVAHDVIPIAARDHLALLSASARDDALTRAAKDRTFFRLCPPYFADALAAVQAEAGTRARRLFVTDDGSERARSESRRFVDAIAGTSMTVVGRESYGSSFQHLLGQLRQSRADAVVYFGPAPTNVLMMTSGIAARVLAPGRVRFMADSGFLPPAFTAAASGSPASDYFTIWPDPIPHSSNAPAFEAAFRNEYAVAAPPAAAAYYTATQVLLAAITSAAAACRCTPPRLAVDRELRRIRSADSLIGPIEFGPSGELRSWRMALVRIRGDGYDVIKELTVPPPPRPRSSSPTSHPR